MSPTHRIAVVITVPLLTTLLAGCPPRGGSGGQGTGLAGRVAYQRESAGTLLDIYLLDASGANESALVATAENDEWPSCGVVPDGMPNANNDEQRVPGIAFVSKQAGVTDIFTIPLTGGVNPVNRTNDPQDAADDAYEDNTPDVSTDNRIAFASNRDGDFDIWVMSSNGAEKRPAWQGTTNANTCVDSEPAWSPDNSKIAYTSDCGGNGFAIWVGSTSTQLNPDGSLPRPSLVARVANRHLTDPYWSPNGAQLVAESCAQSNSEDCDIVIMNADGSNLRNLTSTLNIAEVDPAFSADGQTIIMTSFPAGGTGTQIARMPVAGGAATVMSPSGTHGRGPEHVP